MTLCLQAHHWLQFPPIPAQYLPFLVVPPTVAVDSAPPYTILDLEALIEEPVRTTGW